MKKVLPFLLSILMTSCYTFGQNNDYSSQIDRLIKTTHPRSFNGVVLLQQNGKIKYAKAYGYTDFNQKTPVKISDKFSTMSLAKQFTATLILQAVEKGLIDLHTPIRKYLPDLKYSWADTVTMHHLLNNTSGLYSEDMDKPLKFKPGTAFSYSNAGYAVAGLVLEKQSQKTFNQLVTELFKSCEMKNSFYPSAASKKQLVKGHTVKKDGTFSLNDQVRFGPDQYWGSHLIVTAPDLAKWNECLHKGKLLKPATYQLMTSYVITNVHPLFSEKPIGYGYGLRINDQDRILEFGHTGFHPAAGFTAVNLYYPKSNTSVIVMENQANENFEIAYYFEKEIREIVKKSSLLN
ncbi:serine hydrolase domain-containing protein [Pedobacter gandavensis]|uniref:serine hydrolase domain-containing protein n=1 Tax=Pedobacter TaxID=84567 RepID=UPI001C998869|nr:MULTISPECIES: serine hydrolase domain-containing protein [Pedobacter]WGQ09980.1 serine hydrolase domain-containing protein [Pedobacter gandavensis]